MSSESESENNGDNEVEDVDDIQETERASIREKLSSLSFEDLLKMKQQIGSKLYNETVFGTNEKKQKKGFKRANKNRPREISSKLKYFKRELNNDTVPAVKKSGPRDPRFDPLCGQFDDKTFKSNYKFINGIRQKEVLQLEKELKSCTDVQRKKTIRLLIQRTNNQVREQQKRDVEMKKKYEEKAEIREKLKKGEKPVFKKKSVRKVEDLIEKYEELKKTNKLQKHIEKRTKKLSSREKKRFEKRNE